jgi:peptidoglycan-associated lipoprotein
MMLHRVSHLTWLSLRVALATAILMLLTGCPKDTPVAQTPPPAPLPPAPTVTIDVTPATVQQGQPVTVTWKTENATDVTIEQIGAVQPNGAQSLTPADSATYHITAKGPGGVQQADARVTVVPATSAASTSTGGEELSAADANRLDVFFDLDDASIRPDQVSTIQTDAQFLKAHPDMRIVVEGHCDELGSTEYNLALGDKRAAEVKTALEKAGINSSRMRTVSYGKELPVCAQQSEECWRLNRRAHVTPDVQR